MDEVQEIKNRLDIVQVINEYFPLSKAGVNWKSNCPFHNEKSPSFMVNQERQFYYCFGCNEGGDIFTFIQKIEAVDFPEALKLLAKKAGVVLQKSGARATSQKTRLYDLVELACRYWQEVYKSKYGQAAREYAARRGLDGKTIQEFRIGYAQDSWDALLKFLKSRKYNESEIFQAGLTVKSDRASRYYDRFRDRIIFPINDIHGNVVGFSARAMKDSDSAKYINTPETPIYHKGGILFGLDKAKQSIRDHDYAIVVEGNMDVISSYKSGVQNVAAVSGTALTQEQISLIKRFTSNVIFCFDMDEAGQKAAKRSIDLALANELNIKIVQLVAGKDPDECIKNNPQDWVLSIKQAKSIMQFYFDKVFAKYNVGLIDQKKQAARLLLLEIAKIVDPIEKDYWLKQLAQIIQVSDSILREALARSAGTGIVKAGLNKPAAGKSESAVVKPRDLVLQELLLSVVLNLPENIQYTADNIEAEKMCPQLRPLYKQIIIEYNKNKQITKKQLSENLSAQKNLGIKEDYLNSLYLYLDKEFSGLDEKSFKAEFIALVKNCQKIFLTRDITELQQQITKLEQQGDNRRTADLIRQLQNLITKKNQLDKT